MWHMLLVVLLIFPIKIYAECEKKCVQKCCPDKQYVTGTKQCAPYSYDKYFDLLPVYDDNLNRMGEFKDYFDVKPWGFNDKKLRMNSLRKSQFHLMENGSVRVVLDKNREIVMTFDADYYCLDYRFDNTSMSSNPMVWFRSASDENHQENLFLTYSLIVSSFFLFLVLVVYSLLPELRNLGGLVLMSYVGSLMLAYIFLFIMKSGVKLDKSACIAITLLICIFFFAAFCWMSVMSYDVWWTFRGYAKARPIHRRGESFKFAMYSLFAWGVPLVMTILIGVMNNVDQRTIPGIITPEIPDKGCFLVGTAQLVYFYIPMLMMIICNWVFYLMTAFNIWRLSRGNKVLDSANSSTAGTTSAQRNNKQRFLVYLKLSTIMGLSWILEVVSSFTSKLFIWYITDAYNVFIGLMIFIMFVCKKKILRKLKKRFRGPQLGHQASSSFTTPSRTTESHPPNIPMKPRGSTSYQP